MCLIINGVFSVMKCRKEKRVSESRKHVFMSVYLTAAHYLPGLPAVLAVSWRNFCSFLWSFLLHTASSALR